MNQSIANPGAALKALRDRMGWTLAEVAERTGFAISTLSKIENNHVSLNFDKLNRLSTSLGVDMASLLTNAPPAESAAASGRRSLTRAEEGTVIETANYRHVYHATDLLNKSFIPIMAEVRARTLDEFGPLIRHPGEEWAYVIEGSVELHTDTYAPLLLNTGDSIFFDCSMGHAYLAASPGQCRILSIAAGPGQNLKALVADAEACGVEPAPRAGQVLRRTRSKLPGKVPGTLPGKVLAQ